MSAGALSGLRVVEGSAFVAAPLGGMTLAQLGADVIRFDLPGGGLDDRRWPVTPEGTSLFWAGLNKGKRSVTVDIRRPEGRELAVALITAPGEDAGIFLTNLPAEGWLAYDALRGRRDDLVMLTVTGNPDGGTAVDYTVNAGTGFPYATGPADGGLPVNHALPAWDMATGLTAAVGVLAAERHRARTGEGQLAQLSLADVALAMVANLGYLAQAQLLREDRPAVGNDVYGAFGRDFPTKDGRRVMVVAITRKQWHALVRATEIEEQLPVVERTFGVRLDEESDRYVARDAVAGLMAPWFAARSLTEVAAALDASGACWGPYRTFTELFDEDWRCSPASNPMFVDVDHPGIGVLRTPASPLHLGAVGRSPAARAPRLGEHTEEVLEDVLGLSPGEIGRLHDAGVVGVPRNR